MPRARICGSSEAEAEPCERAGLVSHTPGTLPSSPLEGSVTQRFQGQRTSSKLSLLTPALQRIPRTFTAPGFMVLSSNVEASLIS